MWKPEWLVLVFDSVEFTRLVTSYSGLHWKSPVLGPGGEPLLVYFPEKQNQQDVCVGVLVCVKD